MNNLKKESVYSQLIEFVAMLRGWKIKMICRAMYGRRVRIGSGFRVYGSGALIKAGFGGRGSIIIGDNCDIRNSTKYNPVGIFKPSSIVVKDGCILIGSNVGLSGVSIFCSKSITIEDYVTIGANTSIFDTDFHSLDPDERIKDHSRPFAGGVVSTPVKIRRNAFIGLQCILLKGSDIGENAIVGAGVVGGIKCCSSAIVISSSNIIK